MALLRFYTELEGLAGEVPRHYGIAWIDPARAGYYCLPIPLNLIAGWAHRLWLWLRYRPGNDAYVEAFVKGEEWGYQRGYRAGVEGSREKYIREGKLQAYENIERMLGETYGRHRAGEADGGGATGQGQPQSDGEHLPGGPVSET